MIGTPWGEVQTPSQHEGEQLADGPSDELATRPPRERLYAAMIAGCLERGFDPLTVTDLLTLSGVSRATFYELFESKTDCYVATLREVLGEVASVLTEPFGSDLPPEEQARQCLSDLFQVVVEQPGSAKLVLVEPYVVGEEAMEVVHQMIEELRGRAREALGRVAGHEINPDQLSQAIFGGIRHFLFRRVHLGQVEGLRDLEQSIWDWALSYQPPPQPLRLRGRRPKPVPHDGESAFAAYFPAERIIRGFAKAVAEKGYPATTISDISAHASISQRTFYEYFESKEQLLMAALDSSGMQLTAAVMPAIRRAPGWPDSVRAAFGASCAFFAAEPAFAFLREVAVFSAGPEAIAERDAVGSQLFRELLGPGDELRGDPVAREAAVGALYAVMGRWIRTQGTETMPEAAPLLTYIALAPFLGAERACEVANGDGLRPA